jgi:hypothetical protein
MPSQRNSLQAVLDRQVVTEPPAAPSAAPRRRKVDVDEPKRAEMAVRRPSRQGKRLIAGHFDPKVAKQLRLLAAEEDTSIQALLEEALDLLFVKKGRGSIVRN